MVGRIFYSALALVAALATALVYGVGGQLVISETVSLGTLLALAALMGGCTDRSRRCRTCGSTS